MDPKEIKIIVPKGYEIDKEKSTFEHIMFKAIVGKGNVPIRNSTAGLVIKYRMLDSEEFAFAVIEREAEGYSHPGCVKSGHSASLYMYSCGGTWYDGNNTKISGYLFFKPNKDVGENILEEKRGSNLTTYFSRTSTAFVVFDKELEGYENMIELTGHKSSIYLFNCHGKWYTEEGVEVNGYLYYKPKNE